MLASVPYGRDRSGPAHGSASDVITATVISALPTTAIEQPLAAPERLNPIKSRVPRASQLEPMLKRARTPPVFDESAYFRASQLTVRPSAAEYIEVAYPKEVARQGSLRTTLAIFIDEDGTVARIDVISQRLPAVFEDAALTAFRRAQFRPGKIGDKAVKSRMLVEVEFAHETPEEAVPLRVVTIPGKR
jgi:TonB family protein